MFMKRVRLFFCGALAAALLMPCAGAENPSDDVSGYNPFDEDATFETQVGAVAPAATPLPMTDPFGAGSASSNPFDADGVGTTGGSSAMTDPFGTGGGTSSAMTDPFGTAGGAGSTAPTVMSDPFGTAGELESSGTAPSALTDPFGVSATAVPTMIPATTPVPLPAIGGNNPFDVGAATPMTPTNAVMFVTASSLKISNRAEERAGTKATVSFGEQVTVTATQGEWAQVSTAKGVTGFCLLSALSSENPNTMSKLVYAQLPQVVVHTSPTVRSGRVRILKKGETITMVAVTSDGLWARVTDGEKTGFAPTVYLDDAPSAEGNVVWCGAASTPIMVNPDAWVQLSTLSFGQQVRLVGYVNNNAVAKIRNEKGYVAYCDVSALTTVDPANLNMPVYAQATGRVLFSAASFDAPHRYHLNKNVRLTLLGLDPSQTWALVKQGGRKLYVPYVFLGSERLNQHFRVVVATQDAPLFQSAQPDAAVLGTLAAGSRLNLTGGDGRYAKVATMSDGVTQSVTGFIALESLRAE